LFPRAFFEDPRKRVPLKANIVADIEKQGCQELIGANVGATIDWYTSHVGYQKVLSNAIGRPRVDLNGRPSSKVTAQEARIAQQKVEEIYEEMNAQRASVQSNPMYRVAHQGHDLMKKVTAPDPRFDLSLEELLASITKKGTRASSLVASDDDEFKAEFLKKVLTGMRDDVDAMLEKLK
jgi:sRNA-binding protein